ncbi:MAG: hypothetical protein WC789_14000 [Lentisphaeria bacterium]|jgi:hypothetical protein
MPANHPHLLIAATANLAAAEPANPWLRAAFQLTGVQTLACPADGAREALQNCGGADLLLVPCLPGGAVARLIPELAGLCRGVLLLPDAAQDARQAEKLRRALRQARLHLYVAHHLSFLPAVNRVAELTTAGLLGELREIELELALDAPPPRRRQEALTLLALLTGSDLPENAGAAIPAAAAAAGAASQLRTPHGTAIALRLRSPQTGAADSLRLRVAGSAGHVTAAWDAGAAAAGQPPVHFALGDGHTRDFPVPAGEPHRLCLAAALLCLARGETLDRLDPKPWARLLPPPASGLAP